MTFGLDPVGQFTWSWLGSFMDLCSVVGLDEEWLVQNGLIWVSHFTLILQHTSPDLFTVVPGQGCLRQWKQVRLLEGYTWG